MNQRKTLNVAVSVALGTLVAAGSNAYASSAFFPMIVASDTVTTIVSVINTSHWMYGTDEDEVVSLPVAGLNGTGNLHYRLWYKDWSQKDPNHAKCSEINTLLPTSVNDIQTIDLNSDTPPGVLFEPKNGTGNVKYDEFDYYNLASLARGGQGGFPLRGLLVVDNADFSHHSVVGEALVLEYQTGSAWGYEAFSRGGDSRFGGDEFDYEDASSANGFPVALAPMKNPNMTSAFLVTPTTDNKGVTAWGGRPDSDMSSAADKEAWIALGVYKPDYAKYKWVYEAAIYDRDEGYTSATVPQSVVCVGRVELSSLMSSVTALNQDGGWAKLTNWAYYSYTTAENGVTQTVSKQIEPEAAVIYKLDYGTGFGDYEMAGGTGSWDNALLIPNNKRAYMTY